MQSVQKRAHRLEDVGVNECIPLVHDGRSEVEVCDALLVEAEQLVVAEAIPVYDHQLQFSRREVRVRCVHGDHFVPNRSVCPALISMWKLFLINCCIVYPYVVYSYTIGSCSVQSLTKARALTLVCHFCIPMPSRAGSPVGRGPPAAKSSFFLHFPSGGRNRSYMFEYLKFPHSWP